MLKRVFNIIAFVTIALTLYACADASIKTPATPPSLYITFEEQHIHGITLLTNWFWEEGGYQVGFMSDSPHPLQLWHTAFDDASLHLPQGYRQLELSFSNYPADYLSVIKWPWGTPDYKASQYLTMDTIDNTILGYWSGTYIVQVGARWANGNLVHYTFAIITH